MTPKTNTKKKAKPKKVVKKKVAAKKASKAAVPKKAAPVKKVKKKLAPKKSTVRGKSQRVGSVAFEPKGLGAGSGGQSGDLQGLSNTASADSESVDELLEEGNSFEAEVVEGIEGAPDADQGEVKTHEVSEDDVPEEYLEKDN